MYFLTSLLLLAVVGEGLDIADPIFDRSWVSEVPLVEHLSPSELWAAFYNSSTPVKTTLPELLRVRDVWTNEYLAERFGDETIRTEPDKENRTVDYCGLERMGQQIQCSGEDLEYTKQLSLYFTLRGYIEGMKKFGDRFDRYVISMLPDSIAKELPFLPGFSCGLRRRFGPIDPPTHGSHETQIKEMNFWLSKGSTLSAIHYDMNNQIMCQIDGRKEWRFWDLRTELEHIPMWSGFYPHTMSSDDAPIDPVNVDLEKYPDFVNAKWSNTTLNPGECLLIPARHSLHFVRGFPNERNLGFSVHVEADMDMDSVYACDEQIVNLTHSNLGDFDVLWAFPGDPRESGYNKVRMGHSDWKQLAVYALRQISTGAATLEESIAEMTNQRSRKSRRIADLLKDVSPEKDRLDEYFLAIIRHAPLWREVYTLMNL